MPKRVRVTWRHKGGSKPDGVVYVGRPSDFGNPFRVGDYWVVTPNVMMHTPGAMVELPGAPPIADLIRVRDVAHAVALFRDYAGGCAHKRFYPVQLPTNSVSCPKRRSGEG